MRKQKVSIVVPAYNEESSIGFLLEVLRDYLAGHGATYEYEVIVVDDGSQDKTADVVAGMMGINLIRHPLNKGYGAALKTGIRSASGDIVVTMDADGQHSPKDIGLLLEALDDCDMVVGARTYGHKGPLWRMPGKRALGWLANYLAEEKIPDLNCGLRAVKKDIVKKYLHLCPKGFSFSTTITLALIRGGYRVKHVPITAHRRDRGSKSTVNVLVGLDTLLLMLRITALFGPLKLFLPMSFLLSCLGLLWGGHYVVQGRGLSVAGLLLILMGILFFFVGLLADQIAAIRKEKYE